MVKQLAARSAEGPEEGNVSPAMLWLMFPLLPAQVPKWHDQASLLLLKPWTHALAVSLLKRFVKAFTESVVSFLQKTPRG